MRRVLLSLIVALTITGLAGLAGCGSSGSNRPQTPEDLQALRDKIPLLQADECYLDPQHAYPHCAKYVTELGSTIGALRDELAGAGGSVTGELNQLGAGINTYQQHGCDNSGSQPSSAQAKQCPAALTTIRTNLGALASYLQHASQDGSGTPSSG